MARRKPRPLTWTETDIGDFPDCGDCAMHLFANPMLHEAIASVAIEHPTSVADLTRQYIERYHDNRHREDRDA